MKNARLWLRLLGRYQRISSRLLFRRPFHMPHSGALISFTFDDFPRSALLAGGSILNRHGASGTYFASFGLLGKQNTPTGAIFHGEDLEQLEAEGHELGCHTFFHSHSWETRPKLFKESINKNRQALNELCPGAEFQSFSYPINCPRPENKKTAAQHFVCCRGGGQVPNVGTIDLAYLRGFFLEKCGEDLAPVKQIIETNRQAGGWLIFATHDVSEAPTPYGCKPEFFEKTVELARNSGAKILPINAAWNFISSTARKNGAPAMHNS